MWIRLIHYSLMGAACANAHTPKAMGPSQSRHLMDEKKLSFARRQYGSIQKRAVLYLGPNSKNGDILYLNIEEYLKSLA